MMLLAAALAAASPTTVTPEKPVAVETAAPAAPAAPAEKSKVPDFGEMMRMIDKIFPPQPDPDPARLQLARVSTQGLLPDGTYGRAMSGIMDSVATRVLNLNEAELGIKGKKAKTPSTETLRESILKDDPYFDERLTIIKRIVGEEFQKLSAVVEPRLRDGLARSMARRFDARQLSDLNAFLATDSGKAFGRQSFAMWVDPDLVRSMVGAMPDMIMAAPGIAQRIDKETAHLPKPKKKAKPTDGAKTKKN